jgi:hypothetical protein
MLKWLGVLLRQASNRKLDAAKSAFSIEESGSNDHGPCECCGNNSRTVWGFVHQGGRTVAAYFVQWTLTRIQDHGANFDLVVGEWGDETSPTDRQVVAVELRIIDGGPQFMVIDAADRQAAMSENLAASSLRRDQVIGTPLAAEVFAMLDAIWLGDSRLAEFTGAK